MATQTYPSGFLFGSGTVSNTALALTASPFSFSVANIALADRVLITASTAPIRYRIDGGNPTTTTGHLVATGATVEIQGSDNIINLRIIRDGGSDASASITLLKWA